MCVQKVIWPGSILSLEDTHQVLTMLLDLWICDVLFFVQACSTLQQSSVMVHPFTSCSCLPHTRWILWAVSWVCLLWLSSWLQSSCLLGEQEKKRHTEHGATSLLSFPCQGTGLLLIHAVGFLGHSFFWWCKHHIPQFFSVWLLSVCPWFSKCFRSFFVTLLYSPSGCFYWQPLSVHSFFRPILIFLLQMLYN